MGFFVFVMVTQEMFDEPEFVLYCCINAKVKKERQRTTYLNDEKITSLTNKTILLTKI